MTHYDLIVIGAGGMGSATAYYATLRGQSVLVLEQFALNHEKGSSNDHSRIIRYSYDNPIYVNLMRDAYALWHDLEAASGEKLYTQTGGIDIAHPFQSTFDDTQSSLESANIPFELMDASEARQRFPVFRFDDDMRVLYQADTGILAAAKCVQTHLRLAQQHGAVVKENTPVTNIITHADSVEVHADEVYSAAKLVIAGGAWMNNLLAHLDVQLPLVPVGVQLAYFQPNNLSPYTSDHMPVFITHLRGDKADWVYGIPSLNGSGLKVAFHNGQHVLKVEDIDYTPHDEVIERLRHYNRRYLPGADVSAKSTRICLYTMTPDEHFVIDHHPQHKHIVIASPCSGHGFKFTTLIGKMLTELAFDGTTQYDTSLFGLARYL